MNGTLCKAFCALGAAAAWVTPLDAQRWQMQYQFDQNKKTLQFRDIQFASPARGVAVGVIEEGRSLHPTSLVTADGGAHWQTVPIKETPLSLFFRGENLGWMVTTGGLWQTDEAGNTWRKLPHVPAEILRVHFFDEQNGLAVGFKKAVLETHNGGRNWTPVAAAEEEPGEKIYSAYNWIAFANPNVGIVSGWNLPPRRFPSRLPGWVDPEGALSHRDTPHLSYELTTMDGGKTWKSKSASLFGSITRIRFGAGTALGLVEYGESFYVPSEVMQIDTHTGESKTVYRKKDFAVTDIWLAADGTAYLAGVQQTGELRSLLPGKVQVLTSTDYVGWQPIPVDYRAVATNVILSGSGEHDLWIATDTGMILKLVP